MKQIMSVFILIVLIVGGIFLFKQEKTQVNETYLRIHIRANSNEVIDQNIKHLVKEQVVNFLTPLLIEGKTVEKAKEIVESNLERISNLSTQTLSAKGFSYKAQAKIASELFPTRSYESLTLESGFYDALIINLGSGEGDNWWCVVYPPLCFTSSTGGNIVYQSKIMEIINNFKKAMK